MINPLQSPPQSPRRPARLQWSTLFALLVAACLLLAVTWWWQQGNWPWSRSDSPVALQSEDRFAAHGIDPAALHIQAWHALEDFPHDLAQFETVFWEPQDTTSLRQWLNSYDRLADSRVLEIGTGTGIIALLCAQRGAAAVVASDINPQAVANTRYNAALMGLAEKIDVRLVAADRPAPFAVIETSEQFDLIISNPPWEDAAVQEVAAYALYDPGFQLLDALLQDSHQFLRPHGRLLLAYGAQVPIQRILASAPALGWQVTVRDQRDITALPKVFVPGVLLELRRNGS